MASSSTGAGGTEHRVQIPADGAGAGKATAPERRLNRFVRTVALIERTGNALGTLAFTWATVILLGGYPTELRPKDDFWFATTIVFLEAARILSRNNMSDYQLFFRTRGAFKSLGWNGLVLLVCVSDIFAWFFCVLNSCGKPSIVPLLMATLVIVPFLFPGAARLPICSSLRLGISLWSPMVAILLLYPSLSYNQNNVRGDMFRKSKSITIWYVYLVLFLVVLLLIISRLRFAVIKKLVNSVVGSKLLSWHQDILNLCMLSAIGMSVSTFQGWLRQILVIGFNACVLVIVSFGNLQLPATILRVVLALVRLIHLNYVSDDENKNDTGKNNLEPSIIIFYVMVLGQGILYIVACILEAFSFFLRRSLIRSAGFRGNSGVQYVNLYYAYAFEKCMEGDMFAGKNINLVIFAMDCLNLDSPKMQLYGVQMLHNFLQKEPFKTKAISKLTTSMKTMASLFNMLGWTREEDRNIRTFAAKVIVDLSCSLRVSHIPGSAQFILSLLDTAHQPEIKDPLLDTEIQPTKVEVLIQQVSRDGENSPVHKSWKQMATYCLIPSDTDKQNSCILKYLKQVTKCWSVPEEEPSMDHNLLPVLGLTIIDRLGSFDLENYIEISRATGLVSKIIEFTDNKTEMANIDETRQILTKGLSLKVLRRLSSTKGKFGVTLRHRISEHPFLLSNLAEILNDMKSNKEHRRDF